eukprot:6189879-Pleurochrysis_carterae.AAC.1
MNAQLATAYTLQNDEPWISKFVKTVNYDSAGMRRMKGAREIIPDNRDAKKAMAEGFWRNPDFLATLISA